MFNTNFGCSKSHFGYQEGFYFLFLILKIRKVTNRLAILEIGIFHSKNYIADSRMLIYVALHSLQIIFFMLPSSLICCASGSILISNSSGDKEHPSLQPSSNMNLLESNPCTLTAACGLEYNVCIHFMKLGPN